MPLLAPTIVCQRWLSSPASPSSWKLRSNTSGIEDPHHHLFAERGRQRRQTQLDFVAVRTLRLHAAVLRPALFGDVHPAEDLQTARDGRVHRRRQFVDVVHHAVDAESHVTFVAARFDVDVARALVERVLQQPVDDVDDVRVVRVGRLQLAEFEQLLEVA